MCVHCVFRRVLAGKGELGKAGRWCWVRRVVWSGVVLCWVDDRVCGFRERLWAGLWLLWGLCVCLLCERVGVTEAERACRCGEGSVGEVWGGE